MDGGIIGKPADAGISVAALERALALLEAQREQGLHPGAQIFVARRGVPLLDAAIGEAQPGIPLRTSSAMLLFSSGKPLTAVAIARLYEQGRLTLESPVRQFIPEFGNGKETCTIRHVLTHTGGFPMPDFPFFRHDWHEVIAAICREPAEWPPGTAAGYHSLSGWCILGEIVRRIDGRPVETYLAEEIFTPLGMSDTTLGMSDARAAELGARLSLVKACCDEPEAGYLESRNAPRARRRILPGANVYGSARDLGRFYLMLRNGGEWNGVRFLKKSTVDLFTAVHRESMVDRISSAVAGKDLAPPWGLGFVKGVDASVSMQFGRRCTAAAYGHTGRRSSVAFVEPSRDLVAAIITNGLPKEVDNIRRLRDVADALHEACG